MDPLYLTVLVSGEKKFWALRAIRRNASPDQCRAAAAGVEAVRIVDMSSSNSWAKFAALFRDTRDAFLDHERARASSKP